MHGGRIVRKTTCLMLIAIGCWILIGASGSWFSLGPLERYVTDFTLQSNQTKEVSIKSQKSQHVMFRVDATGESMDTIARGPYPINMTQVGQDRSITSFYGGLDCKPINGQIRLKLANTARKAYRVLIVTVD